MPIRHVAGALAIAFLAIPTTLRAEQEPTEVRRWEIMRVDFRVIERNRVYVKIAYQVEVRNFDEAAVALDGSLDFLDAQGFTVQKEWLQAVRIPPHGTYAWSDYALVGVDIAAQIHSANAQIQRRR